jgi:hypothetical protein
MPKPKTQSPKPKSTNVTQAEIEAALRATKRTGPVLSAHKQGGYVILYLCGDKEPVRWKPPKPKPKGQRPKPKSGDKV